ncbi:MAG: sigma-70 family RNA polymerase sigma factor [Bacteroidetes bacterium]|nr:sigma-70 family RNA polymerase sigma factor [Bacteroidota bacterium]
MTADKNIIEGCIAGKRNAQHQLYNRYSPAMLGVCLRYCRNLEDAEDVLQEGFIKVFGYINSYRGEGTLGAWIKRIMINTALTHIKRNLNFKVNTEELTESNHPEEFLEEEFEYQRVSPEVLIKLIQEMPEGYRTVLNLYVFEEYSHKEIAGILSISESTSKTQLFKARKFLRSRLESADKKSLKTIL